MLIGGGSLFLLLSIVHFWYGMSRYPSIWNSVVPSALKGATLDRNFEEIRDICGYHHNGHDRTNSQMMQFVITLPFTFTFHMIAFLTTMVYCLLRILKVEQERKLPDPVAASIFLSNALVTLIWLAGGTAGIIFATLSIIFNQKAYNSLLFKKNLKDFCISLVFGNLFLVHEKLANNATEIPLSEKIAGSDIEQGLQQSTSGSKLGGDTQYTPVSLPPPMRSLPPLLGASSSSSANSSVDQDKATPTSFSAAAQQTYLSVINDNLLRHQNHVGQMKKNRNVESPPDIFVDETASLQSNADRQDRQHTKSPNNNRDGMSQNKANIGIKTDEVERSAKSSKKRFFGLSRRLFSSPRHKNNQSKENGFENQGDGDLSVEFLNPYDVHLDVENHPGTIGWRNAISESIQRFKIKSYTLRKHNWVMNQMHGRSIFLKENGQRRRKLKRKEIKERCKAFHDKQLEFNSEISGILDDLKDLKKNHNGKSSSEHTRNILPSQGYEKTGSFGNMPSPGKGKRPNKENYTMSDSNYQAPKSDAASTARESLVESSKESTISTLTQSLCMGEDNHDDAKSSPWIAEIIGELKELNDKETDSSSTFKEAINGLLECTPWIDNINLLKETRPIEHREKYRHIITVQNNDPTNNGTHKNGKQTSNERSGSSSKDEDRKQTRNSFRQNFVDQQLNAEQPSDELEDEISGDLIQEKDSPSWKHRKKYPWRSDLQKKRLEKARENRSRSKEVALKQTKRVISIWKKKKRKSDSYQIVEENMTYSPKNLKSKERKYAEKFCGDDERHEMAESHRDVDNQREIHAKQHDKILNNSHARNNHITSSRDNHMENATIPKQSPKTSSTFYERECDALDGVTGVCPHTETEQREDVDYLSDVRLISTERIRYED
jgi:hypothetical protein